MTDIDKILAERAETHGDYTEHATCTQDVMRTLMMHRNWSKLSDDQRETLHMIAHKMGRVVTGNPDVADHWDDIAGYAKLSGDRVRERLAAEPTPAYVRQEPVLDSETATMRSFLKTTRGAESKLGRRTEHPAPFGYSVDEDQQ